MFAEPRDSVIFHNPTFAYHPVSPTIYPPRNWPFGVQGPYSKRFEVGWSDVYDSTTDYTLQTSTGRPPPVGGSTEVTRGAGP